MNDNRRSARAWLLARHASAAPQLDAARAAAVRMLATSEETSLSSGALLRALFHPTRFAWGALVAVWIALAVIHFTVARPADATSTAKLPPEIVARYLAQFQSHDSFASLDRLD